ncbi:serine protease [Patescibacteria group bacterium]|nr:serine protease [Patescibacteria group bacterium]
MKTSSKIIIIVLATFLFLMSLVITGFILYEQGILGNILDKFSGDDRSFSLKDGDDKELNSDTQKRIKQLENKINELEKNAKVPFPDGKVSLLSEEQISAVVELWCPDDDYGYGSEFISIGSGTIINAEGVIITNRHVISNEDWSVIISSPTCYVAVTEDISEEPRMKYMANIVAYSPQTSDYDGFDFDIAVLRIYDVCYECEDAPKNLPSEFPFLEMGYSDKLDPGDYIAVAGYPAIGAGTFNFTEGVVSGRVGEFVIKTDAKIDSGNSGGSALNNKYNLIGIPTWTITGHAESMGYIIGIDQIIDWYNNKALISKSPAVPY